MSYLTLVDIRGIQSFIFKSNRLIDATSGSYLVDEVLSTKALINFGLKENQIVINAGGNCLLKFQKLDDAKQFAAKLTRDLIINKPGLEAVVCHEEFNEEKNGSVCEVMLKLQKNMEKKKRECLSSVGLEGLSITEVCNQTGMPACIFDEKKGEIINQSLLVRRNKSVQKATTEKWNKFITSDQNKYSFPSELDHLGRSIGEKSLIAVIHVDGNGIGQKLIKWFGAEEREDEPNFETIQKYQNISKAIKDTGVKTLQSAIDLIALSIKNSGGANIGEKHPLKFALKQDKEDKNKLYLPIRPIICDGDDITIVTDARIALDATTRMVNEFEKHELPELGKISACAGIAFVHSHAPFSVAYEMAEKLCKSAKMKRKRTGDSCGYIDWIFEGPSFSESPDEIRDSWKNAEGIKLSMRPYSTGSQTTDKAWADLRKLIIELQKKWKNKRSKVKKLRELIAESSKEAQRALDFWGARDKSINTQIIKKSRSDKETCLADAIELMDIYLPLIKEDEK